MVLLPHVKKSKNRPGKRQRQHRQKKLKILNETQEIGVPDQSTAKIIVFEGDLSAPNNNGIKGDSTMPLAKVTKALRDFKYVDQVVSVNECRTSQECNRCAVQGTGANLVQRSRWSQKQCPQCGTQYHRDNVAACNIAYVGLHKLEHSKGPKMFDGRSKKETPEIIHK